MSDSQYTGPILTATLTDPVRELSESEVASFQQNGWVKADSLIPAEIAADMLARGKQLFSRGLTRQDVISTMRNETRGAGTDGTAMWEQVSLPSKEDPLFCDVALSGTLAMNMQRLLGRDVPVLFWADLLACKRSAADPSASLPTGWHQDFPDFPLDRSNVVTVWLALDDVEPDQGAMRFLNGSHRAGLLGTIRDFATPEAMLEAYPFLRTECPDSEPLTYRPGDATFHHGLTVHGATANRTLKPRWSHINTVVSADSLYNGTQHPKTDPLDLPLWKPIDSPRFPVITTPRCNESRH